MELDWGLLSVLLFCLEEQEQCRQPSCRGLGVPFSAALTETAEQAFQKSSPRRRRKAGCWLDPPGAFCLWEDLREEELVASPAPGSLHQLQVGHFLQSTCASREMALWMSGALKTIKRFKQTQDSCSSEVKVPKH